MFIPEKKYVFEEKEIFYLCDGTGCENGCCIECKHTSDINHAKNFRKIPGGHEYYEEIENASVKDLKTEITWSVIAIILSTIALTISIFSI